ncbi:DUF4350 domain-containing protein [Ulvibacterium sp.]|uniref:DUF4350 domain-containing protein n=1 Tax=Ulvibacterium sp. TaxID=2665914 RepID=UPI0026274171|nr:DUF4350 domain-containing protein [Ulvibacterium sp.]
MGRKGTVYITIAVFTIALLMLMQYNKPKKINWFPSYVEHHKIPYGTYILNRVLVNFFGDKITQVRTSPFEFLTDHSDIEGTYFFVNDHIQFGETELHTLLDWTARGNNLFIAAGGFEEQLLDTLHVEIGTLYADFGEQGDQFHRLVHPMLSRNSPYTFNKDGYAAYFEALDTLNTIILGAVEISSGVDSIQTAQFDVIKQKFGEGEIILSLFPKAFTNYFMLKENNKDYTAGLLSYLDGSQTIYMDNHYKAGKAVFTSPMHIFLSTKELKWAYYIILIGALFYVVFEGKRKQRAIPLIRPLKNQTLAFTRTIADMYFEKGEQKQIAEHKMAYFLEYLRSRFYLDTQNRDKGFYANLASRSHHSPEEIKELFNFMEKLKVRTEISDMELKKLNTLIEKFKAKANGGK